MSTASKPASIVADLKQLARFAIKSGAIGAVLALACHLLPPHYRAACSALASLCNGGS